MYDGYIQVIPKFYHLDDTLFKSIGSMDWNGHVDNVDRLKLTPNTDLSYTLQVETDDVNSGTYIMIITREYVRELWKNNIIKPK